MATSMAGIDIGNGHLKMALYKEGDIRLVSARMPRNLMDDGRINDPDAMSRFIKQTKKDNKINAVACALALPEAVTFFRHISMPAMTEDQLKLNLPYEFRDYVTGDPDVYFYDYAIEDTVLDEEGVPQKIELFAAAVSKSTIANYSNILRRAGLKLKVALPREMAYVNLLKDHIRRNPLALNEEFCIIDIGHRRTCIDIYTGSIHVASKVVEYGCQDIDNAIAGALSIDPFLASTYKYADYEHVLSLPECVAVYNQLAIEVMKVINFYNFSNPDNNLQDLYYCGSGAEIAPLIAAIDKQTELAMHKIDALMPPSVAGTESLASCALALAMAMRL